MGSAIQLSERSLAPELNVFDIRDKIVWNRNGTVTLLYKLEGYHEPAMGEDDFNQAAMMAEGVWSSLPEGTSYQFYTDVDYVRGTRVLEQLLRPIQPTDDTAEFFEEMRRWRLKELKRIDATVSGMAMVQDRRQFMAATFQPTALKPSGMAELFDNLKSLLGQNTAKYEGAYRATLTAAQVFDTACTSRFQQMGIGLDRCDDSEIISFFYSLLNPTAGRTVDVRSLSRQARRQRDNFPTSLLAELPYLADASPIASVIDDEMVVRRTHLEVGDQNVTVISLKELPDKTEPGCLVPLLRMGRKRYLVVLRVDIPPRSKEVDDLRTQGRLASGLRMKDFLVKSERSDPLARQVEQQSDLALEKLISSSQRIFGTALHVVLFEDTVQLLEEATQEALGTMSRAYGLRGVRETYALKPAFLSLLPGGTPFADRRRKTLSPNMVDMLLWYDFKSSRGKIPFVSSANSLVLFDPFERESQTNPNMLVTGPPGTGKSVLGQVIISGYATAAKALGEPDPYIFILDNGQSYRRFMELRGDARYIRFDFEKPPGINIFAWEPPATGSADVDLDEHVSRLETLIADLTTKGGNERDDQANERKKAVRERALYTMYRDNRPQDFRTLRDILNELADGKPETDPESIAAREMVSELYSYVEGKFARLFESNPDNELRDEIHAICYDFQGLSDHPDLAAISLRLVIYQIRRFAIRVSKRGHRTLIPIDEAWALLDPSTGGARVAATGGSFIASMIRMGRKEGWAVLALSQGISDFAGSSHGSAIVEHSATKFLGRPGRDGLAALKQHLNLTPRQMDQLQTLRKTSRFHEFLMIQGEVSHVVRVPLDPFSRWIFTTDPRDRDRLRSLEQERPDLTLLERIRLLAEETEEASNDHDHAA